MSLSENRKKISKIMYKYKIFSWKATQKSKPTKYILRRF